MMPAPVDATWRVLACVNSSTEVTAGFEVYGSLLAMHGLENCNVQVMTHPPFSCWAKLCVLAWSSFHTPCVHSFNAQVTVLTNPTVADTQAAMAQKNPNVLYFGGPVTFAEVKTEGRVGTFAFQGDRLSAMMLHRAQVKGASPCCHGLVSASTCKLFEPLRSVLCVHTGDTGPYHESVLQLLEGHPVDCVYLDTTSQSWFGE